MPFTFSHPAAVLPLLGRGPWVAAGLVAGAMAPDVPFFADSVLRGSYRYGGLTHRWWAVPTVDVAIAGAAALWWYGLVRPERRGELRPGWFAVSAAVGAGSHVVWDAFTHQGRCGVRALPVLNRRVVGVPLYTALQYGTSLLGLAALAPHRSAVGRVSPVAGAVLAASAAAGALHRLARHERGRIDELCFGAGAGAALGATLCGLAADRRRAPRARWGGAPGGPGRSCG
ncbi:DUF4184 family protein [Kitasatospora sp. NPDC096147]|uniref:DUF4184 family protein n=1 Tax=Kitasatospora sp. NPDC096147 TaxID=3364093 RepID=UPI0037F5AFC4